LLSKNIFNKLIKMDGKYTREDITKSKILQLLLIKLSLINLLLYPFSSEFQIN